MKNRDQTAQFFYQLVGVGFIILGLIYALSSSLQPYHLAAFGKSWAQLSNNEQLVMLAIMRGSGTGFIAAGLAILMLARIPLRRGESWASWGILAIALVELLPTAFSINQLKQQTQGKPPLLPVIIAVLLVLSGFMLSAGRNRDKGDFL